VAQRYGVFCKCEFFKRSPGSIKTAIASEIEKGLPSQKTTPQSQRKARNTSLPRMNIWLIISIKCSEIGKSHEKRTQNQKGNIFRAKTGQTRIYIATNKLYYKTAIAYSRSGFKWSL